MHKELHAPDPISGWVGSRLDGPGWELLRNGAYVRPVPRACEGSDFGASSAELRKLRWGEHRRDNDEAVSVEKVEI